MNEERRRFACTITVALAVDWVLTTKTKLQIWYEVKRARRNKRARIHVVTKNNVQMFMLIKRLYIQVKEESDFIVVIVYDGTNCYW